MSRSSTRLDLFKTITSIPPKMDVPGQKPDGSRRKTAAAGNDLYCIPCNKKGKRLAVHGYCQTCDHFLCQTCFGVHTIPEPCEHHVLLDKSNMPKQVRSAMKTGKCTIACTDHTDKVIEFYCPIHNTVNCSACSVLQHKPCKESYIPDIAVGFKRSREYTDFKHNLQIMEENADDLQTASLKDIQEVIESTDQAMKGIDDFRKEINTELDDKESKLMELGRKYKAEQARRLQNKTENVNSLKSEIVQTRSNLESVEINECDLFVKTKQSLPLKNRLQQELKEHQHETQKTFRYKFERGQFLEKILSHDVEFGSLVKYDKKLQLKPFGTKMIYDGVDFDNQSISKLSELNVRTSDDTRACWINGMVLLSTSELLVTVSYIDVFKTSNSSIKAIDTVSGKVRSKLKMSSQPWGIAILPQDQAAVTLRDEQQIQVISTSGTLSPVRKIKVNGECRGIDTSEDKLVVSYVYPGKVEVLDHHGGLLHTIRTDLRGQKMFTRPLYVTISREEDKDVIHVSDLDTNTVTKMSVDGQILYTYKDGDLSYPRVLVATGDGHLLVCNYKYNIHVVSKDGKKVRTLLCKDDLSAYPVSVCFSPVDKKLYVGLRDCDKMKVVQFT